MQLLKMNHTLDSMMSLLLKLSRRQVSGLLHYYKGKNVTPRLQLFAGKQPQFLYKGNYSASVWVERSLDKTMPSFFPSQG